MKTGFILWRMDFTVKRAMPRGNPKVYRTRADAASAAAEFIAMGRLESYAIMPVGQLPPATLESLQPNG